MKKGMRFSLLVSLLLFVSFAGLSFTLATATTERWNTQSEATAQREGIDAENTLLLPSESRSKAILVEFFLTPVHSQMSSVRVPVKLPKQFPAPHYLRKQKENKKTSRPVRPDTRSLVMCTSYTSFFL